MAEKFVFHELKKYYNDSKDDVLVVHSHQFLGSSTKKENEFIDSKEKDFIIVNATFGYIMIIEVKKTLNATTLTKSLQQLKDTKEKITQYLRTDILMDHLKLKREWMLIPMIYCEVQQGIRIGDNCSCNDYIITGKKHR